MIRKSGYILMGIGGAIFYFVFVLLIIILSNPLDRLFRKKLKLGERLSFIISLLILLTLSCIFTRIITPVIESFCQSLSDWIIDAITALIS